MKLCFKNVAQAGLLSSVIALAACSGDSLGRGTTGSSGLVISGDLDLGSSMMAMNKAGYKPMRDMDAYDYISFAVEFDDLEVVATAQTDPPTTVAAEVNSDGTFSVDLGEDAAGTAVTVSFVNETTNAVVAEVKFTDTSTTDLNGNPKADSAVVPTGSLQLGAIALSDDGTVSVPKTVVAAAIEDSVVNVATAFDPTGQWAMGAYDKTLPVSYVTVGAADPQDPGRPHVGFKLTLARFAGKAFTPNNGNCVKQQDGSMPACPSSAGVIGTEDRFVLSIWGGNYSQSIGACGNRTGFSEDEARGYGRTHLTTLPIISGTQVQFGAYAFTTVSGGTTVAPYDQPWMASPVSTTAMHQEQDCSPVAIAGTNKTFNGWACRSDVVTGTQPGQPTGAKAWMVGVQNGGCINADTNKPVNVTNWQGITPSNNGQQPVSATEVGPGFMRHTNSFVDADHDGVSSTARVNLLCTHTGGQFNEGTGMNAGKPNLASPWTPGMGEYLGQPEILLAQGAQCDTAGTNTNAKILAGYRCFANAYFQMREELSGGGCGREYNFNWQATKPEDFVRRDDFKGRPKNAFVTNILNYAADGQSATLEDEESENVQIQGSSDSNIFCRVVRKTQINIKSISATKLLVELKDSGRMASTEAACVAAAHAAALENKSEDNHNRSELSYMLEPEKMIFYLNK